MFKQFTQIQYQLNETVDYNKIKEIITNPILWKLTYGKFKQLDNFEVDTKYKYLLITDEEDNNIGCLQVTDFSNIVLEAHIYLLPKYWGTDASIEMVKLGHEWALQNNYKKIFTKVPGNAVHIIKFLNHINYKVCGMINEGIVRNNQLVPLFFYEYKLRD